VSDWEKWQFLKTAPVEDSRSPEIVRLSSHIRMIAQETSCLRWSIAALAHALAADCIPYMLDHQRVGREQIDGYTDRQGSRIEALKRGCDDCDAKARLMVALCLASGVDARMAPIPDELSIKNGEPLQHVYPEVYLPERVVTRDGARESWKQAQWLPWEVILARALPGEHPASVPKEAGGTWKNT